MLVDLFITTYIIITFL